MVRSTLAPTMIGPRLPSIRPTLLSAPGRRLAVPTSADRPRLSSADKSRSTDHDVGSLLEVSARQGEVAAVSDERWPEKSHVGVVAGIGKSERRAVPAGLEEAEASRLDGYFAIGLDSIDLAAYGYAVPNTSDPAPDLSPRPPRDRRGNARWAGKPPPCTPTPPIDSLDAPADCTTSTAPVCPLDGRAHAIRAMNTIRPVTAIRCRPRAPPPR